MNIFKKVNKRDKQSIVSEMNDKVMSGFSWKLMLLSTLVALQNY